MKTSKDKEGAADKSASSVQKETDTNPMRPELSEMIHRHAFGLDENRPDAVAKRQQKNQRTARAVSLNTEPWRLPRNAGGGQWTILSARPRPTD